jgi:hypothetical protein
MKKMKQEHVLSTFGNLVSPLEADRQQQQQQAAAAAAAT